MAQSILIVRLASPEAFGPRVALPREGEAVLATRIGEPVVIALSDVSGIWTYLGVGVIARIDLASQPAILEISDLKRFPVPIIGTAGPNPSEMESEPLYALDELTASEFARVNRQAAEIGALDFAPPGVEEFGQDYESGRTHGATEMFEAPLWTQRALSQSSDLYAATMQAYGHRCCVTHLPLAALAGQEREGAVIPVDFSVDDVPTRVCDTVPLTGTIAGLYALGFLAFDDSFAFQVREDMPTELSRMIRNLNPDMTLALPRDPLHWPDAIRMRSHRERAQL